MSTTATKPKAKAAKTSFDPTTIKVTRAKAEKLEFRTGTRTSKWKSIVDQCVELDDGEALTLPIPAGETAVSFRNRVSNVVYNNIKKPELVEGYDYSVRLTKDEKSVAIVCKAL